MALPVDCSKEMPMWASPENLILLFDFVLLLGLVAGLGRWQKKHGKLSGKRIALGLAAFWTFFALSNLYLLLKVNLVATLLVAAIILILIWGVGYPWYIWIHRRLNSSK
jgi:hypothetical protein